MALHCLFVCSFNSAHMNCNFGKYFLGARFCHDVLQNWTGKRKSKIHIFKQLYLCALHVVNYAVHNAKAVVSYVYLSILFNTVEIGIVIIIFTNLTNMSHLIPMD